MPKDSKVPTPVKDQSAAADEDAPANAVSVATEKKQPPPEKPEEIKLRFFVLLSFWALIVFLGLPIWWKTTTIYRANLPLDQMMDWADGRVRISEENATQANNIGMPTCFPPSNIH